MKKTIWITGAGSGIGKALALQYAQQNNQLILSGRNIDNLNEVASQCESFGSSAEIIPFDITDETTTRKTAIQVCNKYQKIDVLINNAGVSQRSLAVETEEQVGRRLMEVNFFGSVVLSRPVIEKMIKQGGGQIAVISSVVGKFGFPLRSFYAAAKHALHGYFESVALENLKNRVYVTMVCPGRIQTGISKSALTSDGKKHGTMDEGQNKGIPVDVCAKKIIKAIDRKKPEIYIGKGETILIYFKRYFPFLFRKITAKVSPT
jgi:short-subunit dehydrogenase